MSNPIITSVILPKAYAGRAARITFTHIRTQRVEVVMLYKHEGAYLLNTHKHKCINMNEVMRHLPATPRILILQLYGLGFL